MTAEPSPAAPIPAGPPETQLLRQAYAGLGAFAERMQRLSSAIDGLAGADGEATQLASRKLRRQIRDFEPTVTMIGQVKAGKTTLVNALIGWPDLLPADINPWTSVVTSLHLDPGARAAAQKARFRFFDEQEWDRLLNRGGRVGELAARAGAHKELEKVRAQLEQMREKSRQRLGRKFEMLMGQEHEYGFFDQELIQRYVCLGDDAGPGQGDSRQGHFADITRSADLFLGQPDLPHRLCIRDTPGVNDTFMIREQITVNAIRDSRLCVVVLSAHQALSTVDMALIRLISNVNSREVIIFVNRIDELADPVRETEEIRQSIVGTLKALNGPTDAQIIFGSAWWATHALSRRFDGLRHATGEALVKWAEHRISDDSAPGSVEETIWQLSGIPELCAAISERIATGEGAEFEDRILRSARNVAAGLSVQRRVVQRREGGGPVRAVAREDVGRELDAIAERGLARLDARMAELAADLDTRLDGARQSFLSRATASLIAHLEAKGEGEVWTYDPAGLRLLLRSGYRVYATKAAKVAEDVVLAVTGEVRDLYVGAFGLDDGTFALDAPAVPKPPPPVILGATIALDVKGNWWTRWWRKIRSYQAFAGEFSEMIDAEIRPFQTALVADHAAPHARAVRAALAEFVETQRAHLGELADRTAGQPEEVDVQTHQQSGWAAFDVSVAMLDEFRFHPERRASA